MSASAKEAGATVVRPVSWDDAAAVALREAMEEEMGARYADLIAGSPDHLPEGMNVESGTVVYTGVAYAGEDVPAGHVALRRLGGELELKRMFVAPSHRGTDVARAAGGGRGRGSRARRVTDHPAHRRSPAGRREDVPARGIHPHPGLPSLREARGLPLLREAPDLNRFERLAGFVHSRSARPEQSSRERLAGSRKRARSAGPA
ncbi:hypothetical protein ACFQX6_18965 [Streptosporangium lutulentum]